MKVTAISDLHGCLPNLPGGDLLIVGGDLTARDRESEYNTFLFWLSDQEYNHKIVVAGNHDMMIFRNECYVEHPVCKNIIYLENSGFEINGKFIWGSPNTMLFDGINPACTAFCVDGEEDMAKIYNQIPEKVDILVCHSPAYCILDRTRHGLNVGSRSLYDRLLEIKPRYFICGHIHEDGGEELILKHTGVDTRCMNVSYIENEKVMNFEIK